MCSNCKHHSLKTQEEKSTGAMHDHHDSLRLARESTSTQLPGPTASCSKQSTGRAQAAA